MKSIQKGALSYAVLMIVLFAIAALAVLATLDYIHDQIGEQEFRVAAGLIWALTLGFMLIAGAFGLWAIRFSVEAESRRRIGRFVDAMDYLRDGLLAVDRKGRINGSNPAATDFVELNPKQRLTLVEAFPCLSEEDAQLLLRTAEPAEIERTVRTGPESRTLRFRSQPAEGLTLILISDVTSMNEERARNRQAARLQLIGQIARGVAHDFNNLLCGISGHASLLSRLRPGSADMLASIDTITRDAERGVELAGHLLELSKPGLALRPASVLRVHVTAAEGVLRDTLPPEWKIEAAAEDLPAVGLTGPQIEQAILNLGLLAADGLKRPGVLKITASRPGSNYLCDVGGEFAGVVLISTAREPDAEEPGASEQPGIQETDRQTGVLESVISSMLQEAGGALHCLRGEHGTPVYRLVLPYGRVLPDSGSLLELPDELGTYVSHWAIVMATHAKMQDALAAGLTALGVKLNRVRDIVSLLAYIEETEDIDAMIVDGYMFRRETKGILKAILKLRPAAGIVVLCEDPETEAGALASEVVFSPLTADAKRICLALIEAKSLAVKRKKHINAGSTRTG